MTALANLIARAAAAILPRHLKGWGQAMRDEVAGIEGREAARYALGCLGCALREAAYHHFILPFAPPQATEDSIGGRGTQQMDTTNGLLDHPRRVALACGAAATCAGLGYMGLGGAPLRYLAMNGGAFVLGTLILGGVLATMRGARLSAGAVSVVLAFTLLGTALFGMSVNGAARWVAIGGISIQPSLILLPVLVVGFARNRDGLSALAMLIATAAMAAQPDRAMAGALLAGLAGLALVRRERAVLAAMAGAAAGFAVTMLRPDIQPAMPYVDQILWTAFEVSPIAGMLVVGGALVMLLPALLGLRRDREVNAVFGALWLAVIVAAALGNYPTPVVGYGGSAIIGYLLTLSALSARAATVTAGQVAEPNDGAGPLTMAINPG